MAVHLSLALALAVVGFGSLGCTGDRSSFSDEADTICARAIATAVRQSKFPSTDEASDEDFRRIVAARGSALGQLHRLTPPADHARRAKQMLDHFDESQRLLRAAARITGERSAGLTIAAAIEGRRGQAVARRLGLNDCARF